MKKKLIKPKKENKDALLEQGAENTPAPAEDVQSEKAPEQETPQKAAKDSKTVKAQPDGKKSNASIIIAVVLAFVVLVFALYSFGGYKVTQSETILPNVYANGVSLGGMTVEQAQQLLEAEGFDKSAEGRLRVKLPAGVVFRLDYSQTGAKLDSQRAAEVAYSHGHSGNWYSNLAKYISNLLMPVDIIYFDKTLNYEYISAAMDEAEARFMENTADKGHTVDLEKGELTVMKGAGQLEIDKQLLYRKIVDALLAGKESVSYQLGEKDVTMPDFEAIAQEINVEPADASFDENFEIKPSVTGVHLDAGEAKKLWGEAALAGRVRIPLTITPPEVSTEELRDMLFRDMLGSQTTYFSWSSENRINNIKLVSDKLNGLILMPGDQFSFNGYVGERTAEKGFKAAGAYMNGLVVDEIGGGICQVSSTLYCATMLAQMETVERTCHYFMVDYLSPGLDATVSWPDTDFKFRNCREYPVKIISKCDTEEKAITIEIWGTDIDGSYVELTYGVGTWYDEEYPEVAIGKTAVSYRVIYDKDGNKLDTVRESYSAYRYHDWEIQWPEPEEEEDEDVETTPEDGEDTGGTDPGAGGTDPGTGGGDSGAGGTDPGAGGTDPGTGGGDSGSDNSGSGMEDEDGNINFG